MSKEKQNRPEQNFVPPAEEFQDQDFRDTFGEGTEFRQVFETQKPKPKKTEEVPVRKGRPKKKNGYALLGIPHILVTAVWIVIVLAIGISLGRVAWVCVADVLAFGREEATVQVTIQDNDTLETIAQQLQEKGLIRYPELFKLYATLTDGRQKISSGVFTVYTTYDYMALVNSLTYYSSAREEVTITIPEGYTCAQIFKLMEEKGICPAVYLEEYAASGELNDYWFLEGVERGDKYCLEGFLFPDTYNFYVNDEAGRVIERLLDTYDRRFDEDLQAAIATLNERLSAMMRSNGYDDSYIADHQMDIYDITIVASLLEKETSGNTESFKIASVIYNRLTNLREYPYLNIDAALLYAIGHKNVITEGDKQVDTPYNTYVYTGLVPTPICNPGLNSLRAAVNPDDTDYHFYALDPEEGAHHFSETYAEHLAFLDTVEGSYG